MPLRDTGRPHSLLSGCVTAFLFNHEGLLLYHSHSRCQLLLGLLGGVVIDSGDGVTHLCGVWEGYEIDKATARLDIAGREITRRLIKVRLH